MMRRVLLACLLLVLCICAVAGWLLLEKRAQRRTAEARAVKSWNAGTAANYLDSRELWWQKWPPAQMDHGTICISCHTVVPYAFVRPALGKELGEAGTMSAPEKVMLASVEKRVDGWAEMSPYYSDAVDGPGMTENSHAAEAVLNAVVLASYDSRQGRLRPVTQKAFDEAWALQETTGENAGGWKWQDFHLAPWESKESAYQGAALMAVVVSSVPGSYASDSAIRTNIDRLKAYLRRGYSSQPLMSQLYVLWASAKMPDLLSESDKAKLIDRLEGHQQPDGGWVLATMDEPSGWKLALRERWKELNHTIESDGCATGLAVLALETSGRPQGNSLKRGLAWLEQHQEQDGSWWAASLNGRRDPNSDIGRFMRDAATGYAVLALETEKSNEAGLRVAPGSKNQQINTASLRH
jgi:squalene-hopene/tetraprenyl-beta-curcumene cyclase